MPGFGMKFSELERDEVNFWGLGLKSQFRVYGFDGLEFRRTGSNGGSVVVVKGGWGDDGRWEVCLVQN